MAATSKAIVTAFYGKDATRSYFNGCSTGSRQALVAAQRFPADFDGIVAGAAANPKTHLDGWRPSFIPPEKHRLIHEAVLYACDSLDGVKDGLLENQPRKWS